MIFLAILSITGSASALGGPEAVDGDDDECVA